MAESTIQRKVSDPEFTTQTVAARATIRYGSGVTVTVISATNVSSVTATSSGAYVSAVTFNVAKSGYTLVGITTVPAATNGIANSSVAYLRQSSQGAGSDDVTHASLAVSGNTIVATFPSSVSLMRDGTMYLSSITCKYVKNN